MTEFMLPKLALLSNVNIDSFKFKLRRECELFLPAGYGTWQQELLNENSNFYKFMPEFCFIILYKEKINLNELILVKERLPNCHFFVSDVNENIGNFMHNFPLSQIILKYGQNLVYSPKMWYLASNPFSVLGEKLIIEKILQFIRPAKIPSKKCLVLDLDNTLWGGVISEDGVNEIKLDNHGPNSRFYDFQKEILEIYKKGVLLAIASKNNLEDIEPAFLHPFMLLKKEHFSAIAANWQPKSESIRQIAKTLNIGLDSFVFVDDSPVEREEVRLNCPEVIVADFPEDTSLLPELAVDLYDKYFYLWNLTNEDLRKTEMYADNAKREENKKNYANLDDFIKDLNICLSVQKVDNSTIARASQMLQKTNQFNLTTKRYTETQVVQMASDPKILMLIGNVKDKFGDNGFSILGIAKLISETEAEIDSFLMSCRIMGRKIEFTFLKEMEKKLTSMGIKIIYANYIPTAKNSPCKNFYIEAGYKEHSEIIPEEGGVIYVCTKN